MPIGGGFKVASGVEDTPDTAVSGCDADTFLGISREKNVDLGRTTACVTVDGRVNTAQL